jgi:DNA invertase Pin-like site-specific DNA recombinase
MKTIGYLRVSTDKQDNNNQKQAVLEYANSNGLTNVQFMSEIISSGKKDRDIFKIIDSLEQGDNIIIYELSRLARSMNELQSILVKAREHKASIHAISQHLVIKHDGGDIQTQALIFALSISAQIERDMISTRTKNALAVRKAKGLPMGRPAGKSSLDDKAADIAKYQAIGLNRTAIAKLISCNRQTITNWLKARKQ